MKKTYELLSEILKDRSTENVAKTLFLHIGTVKRWVELKEVPDNYFNDLNAMLNYKYKNIDTYRSKDQFFTSKEVAKYCFNKAKEVAKKQNIDISKYVFIEPSAGCCNFYNLLPENRRIGIDIDPKGSSKSEIIKTNYLDFCPKKRGNYFVIGNPPFGLRGNLALRFINHSLKFADLVAFILPPLFESTGKGAPMKRIKGYKLIHSEKLPLNSYYYPNGEQVSIATIFQVWSKHGDVNLADVKKDDSKKFLRVYSISNGKTSSAQRNVKMIGKCDAYLPSTCFAGMKAYKSFYDLPNRRGYGVVFHKNKHKMIKKLFNLDWKKVAFLSTNSALNLRTDLIINALLR